MNYSWQQCQGREENVKEAQVKSLYPKGTFLKQYCFVFVFFMISHIIEVKLHSTGQLRKLFCTWISLFFLLELHILPVFIHMWSALASVLMGCYCSATLVSKDTPKLCGKLWSHKARNDHLSSQKKHFGERLIYFSANYTQQRNSHSALVAVTSWKQAALVTYI